MTIEALDRVRKDMELLLEDNIIEWQGDLKSTYNKYIHPDVLEYKDPNMWKALCNNEILDAFQYYSVQGRNAIIEIEPQTFNEVMDGNALMRLSCEGEQPITKYRRHKLNIGIWYKEMLDAGLTTYEIEVVKEHLAKSYGVASTQESVMRLSMDKRIAGFDLVWANKLRKAIAKAKAKHMIEEVHNKFMESGIALGNRKELLNYVWEAFIVPMLGYAFSEPHLAGYSLILLQEMNLYMLSSLHWKVACLAVDAGDINDDIEKATDYGAIAKAIGNMEQGFVTVPHINEAHIGFKPDMTTNTCIFGLGAISGINKEIARQIIELRPFSSLEDFIERCYEGKIVQKSKMYSLIKAGAFDKLEPNRVTAMAKFVTHIVGDKEKLTTANIAKLIEYGAIPPEMAQHITLHHFKALVFSKSNCVRMINKTQGVYRIPANAVEYFVKSLGSIFYESIEYDDNGSLCLHSKEFDKEYKKCQLPLTEWLKSQEAVERFNYCAKNAVWMKYCSGTLSKWEMDALSFYTQEHELVPMKLERFYSLSNFKDLSLVPETYNVTNSKTGKTYKRNKLSLIAGTVVEKNKAKSMITLNTPHGVTEVKMSKDLFTRFDRKLPDESSWFTRGTKLIISGYRRGEVFRPMAYSDSIYQSTLIKVEQTANGNIDFKTQRAFETEE